MDQQTYEITAPNGKVLSITGDHVPTEAELHEIFAKAGVDTGAKREAGISAAIPGTAYSPDTKGAIAQLNNGLLSPSTREHAQTFLTTPLAHPTGIPPVDSVTSPIGLIGLGTSAATVYKALTGPAVSAIGRAVAVARAAGHEITPTLKYEIAKSTLLAMGIPAPIAYGAATLVSGYRGNGKRVSPLEEAPPTADGYDRYMPNASAGPAAPAATSSAPAPKSAKLADTPVDASMEAIADRLAGGADQPSKGNGTLTARGSAAGETSPRARRPAVAASQESPAAAPAAASPATPPPTSRSGAPGAPAPAAPAGSSPAPSLPSRQGDTVHLPAGQRTKGQMSPTWIQSDLGMAARRQGLTLSSEEFAAAEAAVRDHGVSPGQAVQAVGKLQTEGPPPASKLKFSPDETRQFDLLRKSGKSGAEAESAIVKMRSLTKKLKTPSGETVDDAVARRNETGRWDE